MKLSGLKQVHAWHILTIALLLVVAAGVGAAWYAHQEFSALATKVATLEGTLASTTIALEADIASTNAVLSASLDTQGKHVAAVTNAVSTLQKLQTLDPQLLAKYSKIYFLNENYLPADLATIPTQYAYFDTKQMQLLPEVLPYLTNMLAAAKDDGQTLYVYSAYRSFDTQAALKNAYTVTYGAGTAGAFSADQGYSEHQLGSAVDLITTGEGGQLTPAFAKTSGYAWLADNAYQYGFALSYPAGNSYYIYEPWHWRFVGVALATYLHDHHKYFYDLDQRTIDTYLASIFD